MARNSFIWGLLLFGCSLQVSVEATDDDPLEFMSKEEREALKEEARDMFYHAYNAYIDNAYPADELMPLSCKGRYRGSEPNRGDIDATLGNFSLTLVDTLDTLVVLGDLKEFEHAVKLVVKDVSFDTDVIVSLFETNIRMLGGLLSGHVLAEYLQQRADIMPWYRGELLKLAKDLGYRFLPAFNTTTGIPYGRVNLKHGMKGVPIEMSKETCTACAGSMILEMAALSRLTGEPLFEEKAQKAMDVLWRMRHRGTDLMGSVLNVNSGDWVRRDSGVGAGIDSYYEYCLKAYILLGDEKYLSRFNRHYQAVMKYVSQGPMLLDVHMHRPNTNSKNFMDALLAFWPGLQVLKGDIKPAVETHEMLYQVMQRHNFIPEAFTTDFQVHWGHHPLRPEFLESTYFLYRATGDHYYLGVGRKVLTSLQTYARVSCGYAAVSDVRTNKHDDTMDSFVLSETLKYLFLLFAEPSELVLDLDEFIFTTEGHLLPLTLASMRTNTSSDIEKDVVHVDEFDRACPNSLHLFPASVRQPLRNMVEDVCPRRMIKRRLSASQFQASNLEHLSILSDMGITILTLTDGRVQLLHTFSNAKTPRDAEEGLSFMQEMVELSKVQTQQSKTRPQVVTFTKPNIYPVQEVTLLACPAHFGPELRGPNKVSGKVIFTNPSSACSELVNADELAGKIAIVDRGNCIFVEKARRIQKAGAIAGIVLDNVAGSSAATSPMFAMSGDGKDIDDVTIPVVFLFSVEASYLLQAVTGNLGDLTVSIAGDFVMRDEAQLKAPTDLSMFERLKGSLKEFLIRQMTPQLSTSSSTGLDLKTSVIEQADDRKVIVEYAHFQAVIIPNVIGKDIRINVNLDVAVKMRKQNENKSRFEGKWQYLKWMFVNEIFTSAKKHSSLGIESSVLKDYYILVQTERGIVNDAIKNINLSRQVLWFLKELSEVTSDLDLIKNMKTIDLEKEKLDLWKQYLWSKVNNVAYLKTAALPFRNHIPKNSEWERLFELLESNKLEVENYPLLRKFMFEMYKGDGPQKLLREMFNADESIRRYITLLDHIRTVEHTIIVRRAIDRLNGEPEDESADVANLPGLKNDDITVMEFAADNNEDEKVDNTEKIYKTETKSAQGSSDNVNDFENLMDFQYWTDIGMLDSTIEKDGSFETSMDGEVEENDESSKSNKFNEEFKSQDERRDVDNENQVETLILKKLKFLVDIELKVAELYGTVDHFKLGRKNTDYKEISTDEDVAFVFPESSEIKSNSGSLETVSNDERRKLLQEIQNEISELNVKNSDSKEVIDSKTRSNDPLEEFKKPIWASDEGKVTEKFSEFQQKPEISRMRYDTTERHRFEYREDYTVKRESANVKGKHKGRHIDDEL